MEHASLYYPILKYRKKVVGSAGGVPGRFRGHINYFCLQGLADFFDLSAGLQSPGLFFPNYPQHMMQRGTRSSAVSRGDEDQQVCSEFMPRETQRFGAEVLGQISKLPYLDDRNASLSLIISGFSSTRTGTVLSMRLS